MENAKTTAKEQECSALLRAIADQPLLIRSLLKHKKELTEDFVQHFLTHSVKKVYFCCAAVTLSAYILPKIQKGEWKRVLFVPTGALMSTVSYNEGASVPGIAHGIVLEHC